MVNVPFFFDFGGGGNTSERFIQDNYNHWTDDECTSLGIKKIDGDYKPIPYGVVSLESSQIDSGNITNRFVMARFQKRIGKEMKPYVAYLYSIPIQMSFNITIGCDTMNTMWKIEQAYREVFYKNKTFHVNYRGTIVPARVGFPESITETKNSQYTYGQSQTDGSAPIKLGFSLQVETYQPVFDRRTEMPADQTIKSIGTRIETQVQNVGNYQDGDGKDVGRIYASLLQKHNIMTSEDVLLEWTFDYNRSDLLQTDILYMEEGDQDYTLIETVDNHNCYHLQINDDFIVNPVMIDVLIPSNENVIVVNAPVIKFFCDPETNIVSSQTCAIVDKGLILTDRDNIDCIISYYNKKGNVIENNISINIQNYAVNPENPVTMKDFVYTGNYSTKKIKLFVRDHNVPQIIAPFQDEDTWLTIF